MTYPFVKLKPFSKSDGDFIYLNTDKIMYFSDNGDGRTAVRFMTYRLELGYSELSVEKFAGIVGLNSHQM